MRFGLSARHPTRPRVGRSRAPLHQRLRNARTVVAYWAVVLALAFATATVVSRLGERATAAEHRFGALRPALVATVPMRAGQPLSARNTDLEERPAAQLPDGAVDRLPADATTSGQVSRGEVLTRGRLRLEATSLPPATAAMSVPLGDAPLELRPGDHVDVYATYDPSLAPRGTDATSRVGVRAEVVRATRTSATLAVRDVEVPEVAAAVARSTVTLALVR